MTIKKDDIIMYLENRINIKKSNIERGYCKKKSDLQKHWLQIEELEYIKCVIDSEKFAE